MSPINSPRDEGMTRRCLSFSPAASLPCHYPSKTREAESDAIPIPSPTTTFLSAPEQKTRQLNINQISKMQKEIELEGSPGIVFLIILVGLNRIM